MGIAPVIAACIACLVLGAAISALAYEGELRRMVRFLRTRDAASNARLSVGMPACGCIALARAVNDELDTMQAERIAAHQQHEDFQRDLSSLSHDIRTPLMGAQGQIQLALDEVDDSERTRRLHAANARLSDMKSLLDQLFEYTRAADPDRSIDLVPSLVASIMAKVLEGHAAIIEQCGWEVCVAFEDEGILVDADPESLTRIFENLVDNALSHGRPPLSITQRGNCVSFSNRVDDPSTLDLDRLFERFYQGDAARSGRGSGLGLAVSSRLAQSMGACLCAALDGDTLTISVEFASSSICAKRENKTAPNTKTVC